MRLMLKNTGLFSLMLECKVVTEAVNVFMVILEGLGGEKDSLMILEKHLTKTRKNIIWGRNVVAP